MFSTLNNSSTDFSRDETIISPALPNLIFVLTRFFRRSSLIFSITSTATFASSMPTSSSQNNSSNFSSESGFVVTASAIFSKNPFFSVAGSGSDSGSGSGSGSISLTALSVMASGSGSSLASSFSSSLGSISFLSSSSASSGFFASGFSSCFFGAGSATFSSFSAIFFSFFRSFLPVKVFFSWLFFLLRLRFYFFPGLAFYGFLKFGDGVLQLVF